MHVTQRRPSRLPPARIFSVLTGDGVELRLERLRGGDRGPVILAPGYAMSARVFTLDTLEPSLAGYLCEQGFDVWLLSWRSSPDVDAARSRFTLDDVAGFDWPAASAFVREETGASEVDCVVHCLGAQTLLMSLASGRVTAGVRSAVCLQVGLFYDMPARRRLMCRLGLPQLMSRSGLPYLNVSAQQANGLGYRVLDTVLHAYPVSAEERCPNRTCRRCAFLYGELVSHANLTEATHEQMGSLLGAASMGPFGQLARSTLRGRIVRADGADTYLDDLAGLRIPITFIHGSDNATVLAGSTAQTYTLLCQAYGTDRYRRHVVEGYGHLDCLIGRHAGRDVFPLIAEHLDRTEKAA
jgi:cholesterol oxidase